MSNANIKHQSYEILSIAFLLALSFAANADKNKKSKEPGQLKQPVTEQEQQLFFTDTVRYGYGVRHYDTRMGDNVVKNGA